MNLCFIMGKVIEEIEFEFIYKSKDISIAKAKIELNNGATIYVVGHDSVADFMFRKLKRGKSILIYGEISNTCNMDINIRIKEIWLCL